MAAKAKNKGKRSGAPKVEEKNNFSPATIKQFCLEVKTEFFRIAWPNKKMTVGLAGIVVALTAVISAYLGTVDFVLGKIVSYILR